MDRRGVNRKVLFQIEFSLCFFFTLKTFLNHNYLQWVSCFPIICTTKFILIAFQLMSFGVPESTRVKKWVKWWLKKLLQKYIFAIIEVQLEQHLFTWPRSECIMNWIVNSTNKHPQKNKNFYQVEENNNNKQMNWSELKNTYHKTLFQITST